MSIPTPMPLNKIENFIRKHHVMTLATVSDGRPWCAHVFYAWVPDKRGANGTGGVHGGYGGGDGWNGGDGVQGIDDGECGDEVIGVRGGGFVFTTDAGTRHGAEMESCRAVSAGIALETHTVGRLQGLQIEGIVRKAQGTELVAARRAYLKRFPYAAVAELSLWVLEPSLMKLTDNTLGFGKKLIWVGTPATAAANL